MTCEWGPLAWARRLERKVDGLIAAQTATLQQLEVMRMTLDDILAKVAAEKTVDDSIVTLLNGISQQLKDAIAAGADSVKLKAISDALDANIAEIQDAVTKNTPAA